MAKLRDAKKQKKKRIINPPHDIHNDPHLLVSLSLFLLHIVKICADISYAIVSSVIELNNVFSLKRLLSSVLYHPESEKMALTEQTASRSSGQVVASKGLISKFHNLTWLKNSPLPYVGLATNLFLFIFLRTTRAVGHVQRLFGSDVSVSSILLSYRRRFFVLFFAAIEAIWKRKCREARIENQKRRAREAERASAMFRGITAARARRRVPPGRGTTRGPATSSFLMHARQRPTNYPARKNRLNGQWNRAR